MFGRRRFVGAALAAAGAYTFDAGSVARLLAQAPCTDSGSEGELLGTLPLTGDQPRQTPFGEAVGGPGLDTRVFTDLSKVGPDHLITPADQVFIRTAAAGGHRRAAGCLDHHPRRRRRSCARSPPPNCASAPPRWART